MQEVHRSLRPEFGDLDHGAPAADVGTIRYLDRGKDGAMHGLFHARLKDKMNRPHQLVADMERKE
jgi:hypothetical protein